MAFEQFALVISLFQQLCVYLVIAWLLSKTPLFMPLTQVTLSWPHKILCYLIFSGFCVMGTYFGLRVEDSIANTRAIGAVLGGIVGGAGVVAAGWLGGDLLIARNLAPLRRTIGLVLLGIALWVGLNARS